MTLATGENSASGLAIDTDNGMAYFTANSKLVKIRTADLRRIGSISFLSGQSSFDLMDFSAGYLILSNRGSSNAKATKITIGDSSIRLGASPSQNFRVNGTLTVGSGSLATQGIGAGSTVTIPSVLTISSGSLLSVRGSTISASAATVTNNGRIIFGTGFLVHTSSFTTPSAVDVGTSISYSLTDSAINADAFARDTVSVVADRNVVTLTETTNTSGIFSGSIPTTSTPTLGKVGQSGVCGYRVISTFGDPGDGTGNHSAATDISYPGVLCEVAGSGGGGNRSNNGGSGRPLPAATPAKTAVPAPVPVSGMNNASPRVASMQKRADVLLRTMSTTKNTTKKNALQRAYNRLQKTIGRLSK